MNWWIIAGMVLVTYLTRAPMLVLLRGDLSPWLARWLHYIPISVFTALVVPAFVMPEGTPTFGRELLIGVVAGLVAWRTRQLYAVIAAGMLVFWLSRWWG